MICRARCRWAVGCDLPGTEDTDPILCPRAWKLEDYWKESRDMEEAIRELEAREKYDGDFTEEELE